MQGLLIDPCIPRAWEGFSVERLFRGRRFKIIVHNPQHVSRGVGRMMIDGREITGNLIPANLPMGEHLVEAWLGT